MVPNNFLGKIGIYNLSIDGDVVVVKLADTAAAINGVIMNIQNSKHYSKVVGLDYITVKSLESNQSCRLLVLCRADNTYRYCLVIYLDFLNCQVPESLKKLLSDPDLCFVRKTDLPSVYNWVNDNKAIKCIEVGDLAARVLNLPDLYGLSLSGIATKVGIPFSELNGSNQIQVEQSYMRVLTPEQVKKAVVNAYACAKIGVKLLR